jgi:hypothetical protein
MKKVCLALLVVVVLGIGALAYYADRVIGSAIEVAGERALGVRVRVGVVLLRPLAGRFGLTSLEVANPPGFETPHFMKLGEARVNVGLAQLREQPIAIERVELSDIDVNLERARGKTNYGEILGNQSKGAAPERGGAEAPAQESPVIVRELLIREVRAHVQLAPGGELTAVEVAIPELRLENLGAKEGGIPAGELVQIATDAILEAVARKSGALPQDMARELLGGLQRVPVAADLVRGLGKGASDPAGEAVDAVRDLLRGGARRDR